MIDAHGSRTLADVAFVELRKAIISGDLAPGTPIRLEDQSRRLSMSSVPIREALRFLERSGLVERIPHRGAVVATMSADDLQETYDIRVLLESMAVGLAARNIDDDDATHLRSILERYATASRDDDPVARDLHGELHMGMYRLSRSVWLMRLIPMLWDNSERYRRLSLPVRGTVDERIAEHRAILDACAARDPAAAEAALEHHLSQTFQVAIDQLRADQGG